MKKFFKKTISLLSLGMLLLPLKSLAALSYQPLVPAAFNGFTPTGSNQLDNFLSQAFQFGLAIAAALSVIMIVWGGVEIMISEGPFGKTNGKQKIQDAIWGLLLALVSWLILYIINPDILNFKL